MCRCLSKRGYENDKGYKIAAEMGVLSAEMNRYHNEVEIYRRYLGKRNDPKEGQYIIESILECVERCMKLRGIRYNRVTVFLQSVTSMELIIRQILKSSWQ